MSAIDDFCRMVRARSADNRKAVKVLHDAGLPGHVVGVLRQEIDSYIRVYYALTDSNAERREELLRVSADGNAWRQENRWTEEDGRTVTDWNMLQHANRRLGGGWERSVYKLGCAFIHLSNYHDYRERDPLEMLPAYEKESLLAHMRLYHQWQPGESTTYRDLVPCLPDIFKKISENLASALTRLEQRHLRETVVRNQGRGHAQLSSTPSA